jgi:hypothetical protein
MILYIETIMCFVCKNTLIPAVCVSVHARMHAGIILSIYKQVEEQN